MSQPSPVSIQSELSDIIRPFPKTNQLDLSVVQAEISDILSGIILHKANNAHTRHIALHLIAKYLSEHTVLRHDSSVWYFDKVRFKDHPSYTEAFAQYKEYCNPASPNIKSLGKFPNRRLAQIAGRKWIALNKDKLEIILSTYLQPSVVAFNQVVPR